MKLSITIITIYNNADGLPKTLASVAAQKYPDIEHYCGWQFDGTR